MLKSTISEIQQRFDNDVERFSNLDTGKLSTIDATISLEQVEIFLESPTFNCFKNVQFFY